MSRFYCLILATYHQTKTIRVLYQTLYIDIVVVLAKSGKFLIYVSFFFDIYSINGVLVTGGDDQGIGVTRFNIKAGSGADAADVTFTQAPEMIIEASGSTIKVNQMVFSIYMLQRAFFWT